MNSFYNLLKRTADSKLLFDVSEIATRTITELLSGDEKLTALEYGISGDSISYMLKDKLADIVMIDNSSEAARLAQEKITREGILNIWPMCIDLERDYFMGEFDLIYSVLNLHRASKPDQIIRKLNSFLRPGGHLVIIDFTGSFEVSGNHMPGTPDFTTEQLKLALEKNRFKEVTFTQCFTFKTTVTTEKPQELPIFIMIGKA